MNHVFNFLTNTVDDLDDEPVFSSKDITPSESASTSNLIGESDFILESNHELTDEVDKTIESNHEQLQSSTTDIPEIMSPDQDA